MKKTILIIEDNQDIIFYLKTILKKQYNILISLIPSEGIEMIKNKEIDLILLDYMLPEINGCELIPVILKIKKIPIIIETAYNSSDVRKECINNGAKDIIFKPIDKNKLLKLIERYIGI